jgi:hypothetical protein
MKIQKRLIIIISVLVSGLIWSLVDVQEVRAASDKWRFQMTPYLWLPKSDADPTMGAHTPSLDGEAFDSDNFSGAIRFEAWTTYVGFILDLMYLKFEPEGTLSTPGTNVHVKGDIRQRIMEFAISSYHGDAKSASSRDRIPGPWFELMTGYRFMDLEQELYLQPGGQLKGNENWSEVFAGARIGLDLTNTLKFTVRGDFGVPRLVSTARLTWNVNAGLDYEIRRDISVRFGYCVRDMDYEEYGVPSRFALEYRLMGPWLGATFHY